MWNVKWNLFTDWQATLKIIFFLFHRLGLLFIIQCFIGFVLMAFWLCSFITGCRYRQHEWAVWVSPAPKVPNTSAGGEKWRTKAGIEIGPGGSNEQLQSACQSQRKGTSILFYVKIKRWCCWMIYNRIVFFFFIMTHGLFYQILYFGHILSFGKTTKQYSTPCQVFLATHPNMICQVM